MPRGLETRGRLKLCCSLSPDDLDCFGDVRCKHIRRRRLLFVENAQGLHRLEKDLNLEGFLEKSLKIKYALKSTGKSLKGLEKSLNSSIFCRT